jgi:aminobenzoyl-glutamate utilization protein B
MNTKTDVVQWLEDNASRFTIISDAIWAHPEIAYHEFKSSKLQADFLEAEGFMITWDLAGISTAFVAEWGAGKPVIGFAGEYDALMGLSQKSQPTPEPVEEGGLGHGCGHNLLGTGCMAAAAAVKRWLEATGTAGTVRYYGCPAEEIGAAKTFMARAGVFDDLEAAFNFHPMHFNMAMKGSAVGVNDLKFRFHGTSSHAGASPHLGRSALDAVELMNVGVNYLREHVPSDVRMHYTITDGGGQPNVVPAEAEVWYYLRAHRPEVLADVTRRVKNIAEGAALMTGTKVEMIFNSAVSSVLSNFVLADLQYEAMQFIGPIDFNAEELAYAQQIYDQYKAGSAEAMARAVNMDPELVAGRPLIGENFPAMDEGFVMTGSTDVGDLSWITPLSMLTTACWVTAAPAHTWGIVATGATSIGHKGMMHAAKIMALAAIDLYAEPERLQQARVEFEQAVAAQPYESPIPEEVHPQNVPNPMIEEG